MARFLSLAHQKGIDKARGVEESPIVSNMIPEEKIRDEDVVSHWTFISSLPMEMTFFV
jgi:hypothetical protein